MNKYVLFVAAVILVFVTGPYLVSGMPASATARGVALVSAGSLGTAAAVLIVGLLGLLYKPNRFAGFVAVTIAATAAVVAGANA